ncbi:IPT/TIG domain-containing protein [Millionella massiliensis]|uniref:IPT/TIG domain-containing protein n=1 Tax=Millionella massiliensis TaxID=1871023 RepID=UPI0008D8F373|nr:IPT/TIG domain-containing protein [Millionella massiliensis]
MKKLFVWLSLGLTLLSSCNDKSKDTPSLITDPVLPPVTEEFTPGTSVTISGTGFTASDEIWLRLPVKATGGDIQATITSQTSTQITFTVPEGVTPGEYTLILKRGSEEMQLGAITIGESSSVTDAKLYGLGPDGVYGIDKQTYALNTLVETGNCSFSGRNVYDASKNTIYSIEWDEESASQDDGDKYVTKSWLGILNLNANTYTRLDLPDDIDFFVHLQDGQPTLLAQPDENDDHIRIYTINLATGALTETLDLGSWKSAFEVSGDYSFQILGSYLKGQSIYMAVSITEQQTYQSEYRYLALDLSSPAIIPGDTIQSDNTESDIYFFERQGQLYTTLTVHTGTDGSAPYFSRIQLFDPANLTVTETFCTLEEMDCYAPQYDAATDRLYWPSYWENVEEGTEDVTTRTDLYGLDFTTRTATKIYTWDETIWDLVLAY